jgi:hypothetical protein
MLRLNLSRPPRLPASPVAFEAQYQNQLNDILRLYFNQLDNALAALFTSDGGVYIDAPNGLFFDTDAHTPALANTAYPVYFNQTYLNNSISIENDSEIRVAIEGVYNFQYSGQLTSTNSSSKDVWVWLSRNGVDIGYSTHAYTISGNATQLEVSWNFNIDLQAGDYIELRWGASDASVTLTATTSTAPHPGIASSVIAVNFVAPLPDTLPTPPTP